MSEQLELFPDTLSDAERQRCEVWTRVMGYHRPVESWNIGKRGEHAERKFFREDKANEAISQGEAGAAGQCVCWTQSELSYS